MLAAGRVSVALQVAGADLVLDMRDLVLGTIWL